MTVEHDVVVLGTGCAGLVAALAAIDAGADVGLYEKAESVGGTTATSGGIAWVPINPDGRGRASATTREDALAYLGSLSHGMIDLERAAVLIDTGPEMARLSSRRRRRCAGGSCPATPTTTPSIRAGSPAAVARSSPSCTRSRSSASGRRW